MYRRFVAIWFCSLEADWGMRKQPELKIQPFVIAMPERGRMVVKALNTIAQSKGIRDGMAVADCRAILPELKVLEGKAGTGEKLLRALAVWCIRYTPIAAIDPPDGLMLEATGCTHLWGSERSYLQDILARLNDFGYRVQVAIADTIGAAWAAARFGNERIVESGKQVTVLSALPPAALRLETNILTRLIKLGLSSIGMFMNMPRPALRRRFGQVLLTRLDQALGKELEVLEPVLPVEPYQERLPCLEAIRTDTGIKIALRRLLEMLCMRLKKEEKGVRKAVFKGYRIDGHIQQIEIGTIRPSQDIEHLFRLFEIRIDTLEPDLGFEVFTLDAPVVESVTIEQEALWNTKNSSGKEVAELLDRIAGKIGIHAIHRYLPDEHYLPERSFKAAVSFDEKTKAAWQTDMPRPVHLLSSPEVITVMVPLPDYPPVHFIYKGQVHRVVRADGPERIEQEWWIKKGLFRDYYIVEDEMGARYWLFRSGHYERDEIKWFVHGFFA